ncbi:MAG: flagellar biosynthetic protein FliO [Planctomycetota bacterium]
MTVIALTGVAILVCKGAETPNKPDDSSQHAFSTNKNTVEQKNVPPGSDTRTLFYRMMVSVLVVFVLGGVAIYFSKKFGPRITNLAGRQIHVIETVRIGSNRTIHLLEVAGQKILIGATNEQITKLADVDLGSELNVPESVCEGDE